MGRKALINPGDVIGDIEILSSEKKGKLVIFLYRCKLCGKEFKSSSETIRDKKYKCCPECANKKKYDISGQYFGRLKVIEPVDKHGTNVVWLCECECGKTVTATVNDLHNGNVQSCGCLRDEIIKDLYKEKTAVWKLTSKPQSNNTSGKTGVYYDKSRQRWIAIITFKCKSIHLGRYKDKIEAIRAREEAEKHIFGDFLDWYKENYPKAYEKYVLKNGKGE